MRFPAPILYALWAIAFVDAMLLRGAQAIADFARIHAGILSATLERFALAVRAFLLLAYWFSVPGAVHISAAVLTVLLIAIDLWGTLKPRREAIINGRRCNVRRWTWARVRLVLLVLWTSFYFFHGWLAWLVWVPAFTAQVYFACCDDDDSEDGARQTQQFRQHAPEAA